MIYEFINPGDRYTFEAPDDVVATLACLLMGAGQTPWRRDDEWGPIDLFGDGSHRSWFAAHGLDFDSLGAIVRARKDDVAAALESFVLGDRAAYLAGLPDDEEGRATYATAWDDQYRSSLNRWGAFAATRAQDCRAFNAQALDGEES